MTAFGLPYPHLHKRSLRTALAPLAALLFFEGCSGISPAQDLARGLGTAEASTETPAAAAQTSAPARVKATVTRVVDGDTIEVQIQGVKYKVRYIGIDTPETVAPRKPIECFGKEATKRNKELVQGKVVELEKDVSETDRFGRLLRYVYVDGQMVNEVLVREGYAHAATYPPDVKNIELFQAAQREARGAGIGLWGACAASAARSERERLSSAVFVSLPVGLSVAAPPGVIEGVVSNLTPGGGAVDRLQVNLHIVSRGSEIETKQTTSDGTGNFSFTGLDTASGYDFIVSTQYRGVFYSQAVPMEGGAAKGPVQLAVYETTEEDPGLRIGNASLIIAGVDSQEQMVVAMEVVSLINPGVRTYIPNISGPRGPMGLVRFSLPVGASDLTLHQGVEPEEVIQVDKGFAITSPVVPGDHEVVFAYRFPYRGGEFSFSKSLSMDTEEFLVLATKGPLRVSSPQLLNQGTVSIGGKEYVQSSVKGLLSGSTVDIQLKGLPGQNGVERAAASVPAAAWGGIAIMIAVAMGLYYMARHNLRTAVSASVELGPSQSEGEIIPQRLLLEMAHLDEQYEASKLSEEEYIREREALKEQVRAILRGEGDDRSVAETPDQGKSGE